MELFETLKRLTMAWGPSGCEGEVSALIEELAAPYADEVRRDTLGNLIVHRKGPGAKLMLAAHMDSLGVVVTHIDEKGFARFSKVGGIELPAIYQTSVRFQNGVRGIIAVNEDKEGKELALNDLYLDIGAKSRAEAEKLILPGDMAVFGGEAYEAGGRIVAPYLDNRVGCLVLLMALEAVREPANDLYFVFTVQEEVGTRGARTAAYGVAPDWAAAVDVTGSDDVPEAVHGCSTVLGGGAAIKVMDHSVICHPEMVERLTRLAAEKRIPAQRDVLRCGGTDAGAIYGSRGGVITGGISIPCRYMHTTTEMVDRSDIQACAGLVTALAESELPKL